MLIPRRTSDKVCCPACRQRAPFLASGLPDWHTDRAGELCAGVLPPYVRRRP